MSDMTDPQQTFVADHIADLGREAAAIRAERNRDQLREDSTDLRAARGTRRIRFGRWLMTFGALIAGSRVQLDESRRVRSALPVDDPCGDGHDRLAPAA